METPQLKTNEKYIFAFVGLPARGKSYLSRKLATFLDWMGYESKVFSIGIYRRTLIGVNCDWKFFEDSNYESQLLREKCIVRAIDDMINFLWGKGGQVGIIDGANVKTERRRMIEDYIKKRIPNGEKYNLMWIESVCTLEDVIEHNIIKNKLKSPDYIGWNEEHAVKDFRDRIKVYERDYEGLSEENDGKDCTFIQLINYNSEIVIRNVKGFLQSKVLSFLVNLLPGEKPIYFTRHGGSENSEIDVVGGDTHLSEQGINYAKSLVNFLENEDLIKNKSSYKENPVIFCSTLKRTIQTANELKCLGKVYMFKCLDDLDVGVCDGLTYKEIKEKFPKEFEDRSKDKLNYRYPRGESYRDLINRIEPIIHELERRKGPVIVIGHQATLRCLYGYFTRTPLELIPHLNIPPKTVIRKLPQAYGFNEGRFKYDANTNCFNRIDLEQVPNFEDNLYNIPQKLDF